MPRELIDTGTDKRFVRRNKQGKFKESDDVGFGHRSKARFKDEAEEGRRRQGRPLMRHVYDRANYRAPWTSDDLARLGDLIAGGTTIPDIANMMGRSQEAVRCRATPAGILAKRPRKPLARPQPAAP